MGKAALMLVLGLSLAFAVIGQNLHKTGSMTAEFQTGYLKYASARNLARTAVHARLRTIESGGAQKGRLDGSFNRGTYYTVVDSLGPDSLRMIAWSRYEDSVYTMRLTLQSYPKPFPGVSAAIGIRATPVSFSMSGSGVEVNGNNHNEDGSAIVASGHVPGVATLNKTDSTTVYNEGLDNKGVQRIKGSPSAVTVNPNTPNPADFMDEYREAADSIYNQTNISGNRNFGSPTRPSIIFCESLADTNYKVKFAGNVTGYGILAIRGNLEISGTFNWYGLVIVFGEANTVTFGGTGTPSIVGGLIVARKGDGAASLTLKGSGNQGKVLYSSAALERAKKVPKLTYYRVVDWYE